MLERDRKCRGWRAYLLGSLAAPIGVSLALAGDVGEALPPPGKPTVAVAPQNLAGLRQIAIEKQPSLKAYRASVVASQTKLEALDKMRLAGVLRRDIPIRRKQASEGITAAEAQLHRAEWDSYYAVTRNYLSVVFANELIGLGRTSLSPRSEDIGLEYLKTVQKQALDEPDPEKRRTDVKPFHANQIDALISATRGRLVEAEEGLTRAQVALKEALGLPFECAMPAGFPIGLPDRKGLPQPGKDLTREKAVALALSRRGELQQAQAALVVTDLEVAAQRTIHGLRGETFASGSDLHAEPVPQGIANGDYRPSAIGIEMPAQLVGHRAYRIEQAHALQGRAAAVLDKTKNLVTLETEDAYLKWEQAHRQTEKYLNAIEDINKSLTAMKFDLRDVRTRNGTFDQMLDAIVRRIQYRVLAAQAQYLELLALSALERVTAGGFFISWDTLAWKKK